MSGTEPRPRPPNGSTNMPMETGAPTEAPAEARVWPVALGLFFGLTAFWLLFSTFFESFYRDDNVGGTGPILSEMARQLLAGQWPTRSFYLGGGGGTAFMPQILGIYDPLVTLPALLLHDAPETLHNVVLSLHLALFGAGGYVLGRALKSPPWACTIAALSLGFSGFFLLWGANWRCVLIPFAFLPWLLSGLVALVDAEARRSLLKAQVLTAVGILGVGATGLPFATFYGGIAAVMLLLSRLLQCPQHLKRTALRLLPHVAVVAFLLFAILMPMQHAIASRVTRHFDGLDWTLFAVPMGAYIGLFSPISGAIWQGPFFREGTGFSNLLLICGTIPAWSLLLLPVLYRQLRRNLPLLTLYVSLGLWLLLLSPAAFALENSFKDIPLVGGFRWPFRALPAFHVVLVAAFLTASATIPWRPKSLYRVGLYVLSVGLSLVAISYDLSLAVEMGSYRSWFRAAPMLADKESWSPETLTAMRRGGYVANICKSEGIFHRKPRLFFYGNLGATHRIKTVHHYVVPPFSAYANLGMTLKGCCTNPRGILQLIEEGPQSPAGALNTPYGPEGPKSLSAIAKRTYVGTVIIDQAKRGSVRYFRRSPAWRVLEERKDAIAFSRVSHAHEKANQP